MTQPAVETTPAPPQSQATEDAATTNADATDGADDRQPVTLADQLRDIGVDLPDDFEVKRLVSTSLAEIPGDKSGPTRHGAWRHGEDAPWPRPAVKRDGEKDDDFKARAATVKLYKIFLIVRDDDGSKHVFCLPKEDSAAKSPAVIHLRGHDCDLEEMDIDAYTEALHDALVEEDEDLLADARGDLHEAVEDIKAIRATTGGLSLKAKAENDVVLKRAIEEAEGRFIVALETYAEAAALAREEDEAEDAAGAGEANGSAAINNGVVAAANAIEEALAENAASQPENDDLPAADA